MASQAGIKQESKPQNGVGLMRALLSIVERAVAVALAAMLSACAASGPSIPSAAFVGSRDIPDKSKREAAIADASDIASLPGDAGEVSDPFEKMNRSMFERNMRFNHAVIYPAAKTYHNGVPEPVRNSIGNFVSNLNEPFVFANDVLQLRLGAAATTVGRFAINSTVGVGGLFDIATKQKLQQQSGDFGQTLYIWGMRNSPYLVLPVIGPTNVRDLFGTTVELAAPTFAAAIPSLASVAQASNLLPPNIATTANNLSVAGSVASPFTKLDQVIEMAQLEDSSIDFYSMMRSVVYQKRQAELDEALQTSGWTAVRPGNSNGAAAPDPVVTSSLQVTVPKTKEQDLVASAFPGLNN
ncbi:MAG TPA: VacJ family lipoprotein [Methyloceanibacter sp.]|nr:VacJ family lipoprotein [Methyloceanibacter sp.]